MSQQKISIRFFNEYEVRAVWEEANAKWWFSVLDIVAILNNETDYNKTRNYWKLRVSIKAVNKKIVDLDKEINIAKETHNKFLKELGLPPI